MAKGRRGYDNLDDVSMEILARMRGGETIKVPRRCIACGKTFAQAFIVKKHEKLAWEWLVPRNRQKCPKCENKEEK